MFFYYYTATLEFTTYRHTLSRRVAHPIYVVGRGLNHGNRIVHPEEVELADSRRVPLLDQEAARALVQALDHLVLGIGELQAFDVVLAAGVRIQIGRAHV